jgi:Ala-tRNA(Pro) deacylase
VTTTGGHGIEAVRRWLDAERVAYEVLEHAPTYTALADAEATGVPPASAAKVLALRHGERYRLAVIPAPRRLDIERVGELLGEGDLRLASEAELEADFPLFEVGALPPLGPLLPAPEVVDVRLIYRDRIVCPGGDHRHSLALDPRELIRVTEPLVADICEHEPPRHDEDFYELPRI